MPECKTCCVTLLNDKGLRSHCKTAGHLKKVENVCLNCDRGFDDKKLLTDHLNSCDILLQKAVNPQQLLARILAIMETKNIPTAKTKQGTTDSKKQGTKKSQFFKEPKESKSKPNNKKASPPKLPTEQCDVCMVDVSKANKYRHRKAHKHIHLLANKENKKCSVCNETSLDLLFCKCKGKECPICIHKAKQPTTKKTAKKSVSPKPTAALSKQAKRKGTVEIKAAPDSDAIASLAIDVEQLQEEKTREETELKQTMSKLQEIDAMIELVSSGSEASVSRELISESLISAK